MEPTTIPTKKSNGAVIGVVIAIIILVLAAVFFMKEKTVSNTSEETYNVNEVSASDEVTDIEADLNSNADMDALDAGLE